MLYVHTLSQLEKLVSERKSQKSEIRKRVNRWIERVYGIPNYLIIMEKHFPFSNDGGKPVALLARQIASVCTEDITCAIFAQAIGLRQATITFVRDTFTSENHDKKARVKIPWIEWSKKGNVVWQYQNIGKNNLGNSDGMILDHIPTFSGQTIQEFHSTLREKVFTDGDVLSLCDTSSLHSEILQLSTNKPSHVYENKNGVDLKIPSALLPKVWSDPLQFRPPGSWYYPLYLSWFLTGDMILLETYENPNGGVPQAKKLFAEAMKCVEIATGFSPIVIETLPLTLHLLACNKHVVGRGQEVLQISEDGFREKESLLNLYTEISEIVFRFR